MAEELMLENRVSKGVVRLPRFEGDCAVGEVRGEIAPQLQEVNLLNIPVLGGTLRVQRLRTNYFKNRVTLCIHHARIYTKVYRETEAEPMPIRRGKAFKRYCEEKPIVIQDDELIVGGIWCGPKYIGFFPEESWQWVSEELDSLSSRAQDPYIVTEEQKRELREEILPYWRGKSVEEHCFAFLPPETRRLISGTGFIDSTIKQKRGLGHANIGIGNIVLPKGFKGIEETARDTLQKLSYVKAEDHEKIDFLNGVILCCQGMKILGERHAAEAGKLAEKEDDPQRKAELLEIGAVCDWVPYNPPRTFREALQALWFTHLAVTIEQSAPGVGMGRFDYYMYPYYEKDVREGIIAKEEAQELVDCLWVKEAEIMRAQNSEAAKYYAGYKNNPTCNLGGLKRDGTDATNELTYMCFDATDHTRLHSPPLVARVHRNSPDKYMMRIAEIIRLGLGFPAIFSDDVGIPVMLSCGASIEDAYEYDIEGCSEALIQGKMWKYSDAGQVNMGACIEFALNDGWSRIVPSDRRWGLPTGDPRKFKSYEEVEDAFKKQLAYLTEHICIANMVVERMHGTLLTYPYTSSLFEGPVETGVNFVKGGAKYNVGPAPSYVGLADVANALASIKKIVFEDKKLTMDELIDALDKNFEGREDLRLMLLNQGPKYGRDDSYVDSIAKMVADFCHEEASKYTSIRGCKFTSAMFPVSANTPLGMVVGALPSARRGGVPLADGVSPQQGTDRSPTEVIKSVTSYDHIRHENGLLLNLKFNPTVLEGEKGLRNFISLVRTFCDLGGWHIQVNVVSNDTLKDAQNHPEKYPSLMVRVAGYSAFFVDLCRETQNDIISRTEHCSI